MTQVLKDFVDESKIFVASFVRVKRFIIVEFLSDEVNKFSC